MSINRRVEQVSTNDDFLYVIEGVLERGVRKVGNRKERREVERGRKFASAIVGLMGEWYMWKWYKEGVDD